MTHWSCGLPKSRAKLNYYISTTTVSIETKLGRLVTNFKVLLIIKSHDPLIKWCSKIMRKTIISSTSLPQYLWPTNFAGLLPINSHDSWICVLIRSRDKLKLLCLYYYSAYGNQTWQFDDLPWGAPVLKAT